MNLLQTLRLLFATGVFCVWSPGADRGVLAADEPTSSGPIRRYDGRTLEEWRRDIQLLDFQSPDRAAVVPGLREIILDPEAPWFTRRQAALTLGRIGAPGGDVVKDLARLLDEKADPVETAPPLWALKALALFGPLAREAAPRAAAILRDEQRPIILRMTATETLGRIGIASAEGIAELIEGAAGRLGDDLDLRIASLEALQLAKPPSAVPVLIAASNDPSERVRYAAATTLGFFGSHAEPAAEGLGSLVLSDEVPIVREAAARSLAQVGPRGIEILLQLVRSGDVEVQLLAIDGAGRVTAYQSRLAEGLAPVFDDRSAIVAARAMDAYWRLARRPQPILNRLVRLLEDDDRQVKKAASDTLMAMGIAAAPARPELERLSDSADPQTRTAANRVLRSIPSPD
jgi:HEAT repeat protein